MADPVNAADVLVEARTTWKLAYDSVTWGGPDLDDAQVDALLACGGGDPVVIMPDGTLRRAFHRGEDRYCLIPVQP